jgi:glycogen operon protein
MAASTTWAERKSGSSAPLGATCWDNGVNFSLFSRNATAVSVLLYKSPDDIGPSRVIPHNEVQHKTYHYWHIFVSDIGEGQLYAYQVDGPKDPGNGHYFDATKPLLDPYSKGLAVPAGFSRKSCAAQGPITTPPLKSVVTKSGSYDWEGDKRPCQPFAKTVIYELHVAGFTKHQSSGLSEKLRGTYRGLIEKLPYLVELGITAIELLPVFQFDQQDAPEGKVNYWGYAPISFLHHIMPMPEAAIRWPVSMSSGIW